jgi:hypothetical protein
MWRPEEQQHQAIAGESIGRGRIVVPEASVFTLVVVVLVPIMFLVPAAVVFLPPLMPFMPAMLPRFVQLTTLVICLSAVASMFLDCLVEFMFCVSDPALTSVEVFCLKARHCRAKHNRCEND